jgi:hypothetical protein
VQTYSSVFNERVRNKGHLRAIDLVPAQHTDLRNILKRAELKYIMGYDIVHGTYN